MLLDFARALPALLLMSSTVPACIIPLAPDFQDPPAAQNVPPEIIDPNPAFGAEVGNPLFQVNVTDLNGGDDLFVLWVSDYPEMVPGTARQLIGDTTRIPAARDGTPQVTRISMTFDCKLDFILGGLERHRIEVIVGDRPFATGETDLTLLVDRSHAITGNWYLDKQCPSQ